MRKSRKSQLIQTMEELDAFIESNPDPRELKRALAVSMTMKGYKHREIIDILQVS